MLTPDAVLGIWQEIAGAVLSPVSVERFKGRSELPALCHYSEVRLRGAATELYRRSGQVLLAEWVRECAWDGGGSIELQWAQLEAGDIDAEIMIRDLLVAAVADIDRERDRTILCRRLGLDGSAPMTLQEVGVGMRMSAEAVRQRQDRTIDQLCRPHMPPWASNYAGVLIAGVVSQAAATGTEPAGALLRLADAAAPSVPTRFAVQMLARLAGRNRGTSEHLAAEAMTVLSVRQAELARATHQARAVERSTERWNRMLARAEWPGRRAPAPQQSSVRPQREPEGEHAGRWPSVKLDREVSYDSAAELSLIRVLDQVTQVRWFCEQPLAIGYNFAGRHRTYYPDLLVATGDDRCVLIEIKALTEMPLAVNQAKAAAARAFCARLGWGYLLTDVGGQTPRSLLNLRVPEQPARAFAAALDATGTMTWRDVKEQRVRCQLSSLQVSALAMQRGWDIRLDPYRIRAGAGRSGP